MTTHSDIKKKRKELKFSQKKMAKLLFMSEANYQNIELGKTPLMPRTAYIFEKRMEEIEKNKS